METSSSLLERLRGPQAEMAWSRFVDLYTPLLFYWARKLGLQDATAQDLVQDVFTVLLQKMPEFRYDPQKTFRGWLRTVTLNVWREKRRRKEVVLQADSAELRGLADSDDVDFLSESEHQSLLMHRALQLMQADFEPASWQACWKIVVEGKPTREVAEELGLSVGAVHAAKFRILARLRQELAGMLE